MEREFINELNALLISIYSNISAIEAQALKKHGEGDLSISEFHILEAVSDAGENGCTVGEIASRLSVTFPTVTVAVNKLCKKGCVEKTRGAEDGRIVRITLTRQGRRMNAMHRYFHERMACEMCRGSSDEELENLMNTLQKLNVFLQGYTENDNRKD